MLGYIDPGTGSMLFTVLIGVLSALIYGLRGLFLKIRYSSRKDRSTSSNCLHFVIYSDSKRYWNVFKPICDLFEKNKIELTYYTQSEDDPALSSNYQYIKGEYIGSGNASFAKLNFLQADIVLSTTPSLDVYQWKRSKDVKYYVHLLHGIDDITTYRMFGIDYYDALILSGEFQEKEVRLLEQLRNLPTKEIKLLGVTYVDELLKRYNQAPRIYNDRPVVLLAPSWGPSSILNKYGKKAIDALLNTGYQIVVRPHPQSKTSEKDMLDDLMAYYQNNSQLEWNFDNDNFDILNRADILISDFSAVMFDYTFVFDKPIIYADTSFDSTPYDAGWLEEPLWKFSILPYLGQQLKKENLSNIKELIDNTMNNNKYKEGREKARREAWLNKGHAAESIFEYMLNKQNELTAKEETK